MTKSLFDGMPKDIQKAIMEAGYEVIHPFGVDRINARTEFALKTVGELTGHEPYILPDEEIARIKALTDAAAMKYYREKGGALGAEIIPIWEKHYGKKAP